jgi:hypothetical protein
MLHRHTRGRQQLPLAYSHGRSDAFTYSYSKTFKPARRRGLTALLRWALLLGGAVFVSPAQRRHAGQHDRGPATATVRAPGRSRRSHHANSLRRRALAHFDRRRCPLLLPRLTAPRRSCCLCTG